MKLNVLTRGLTSGATYNASVLDYHESLQRQYEKAKRQQEIYENRRREYEKRRKEAEELQAKLERERKTYLEKLKNDTTAEEREAAAVRAQEAWGKGETPNKKDADLFEVSDYKREIANHTNEEWYEKAWRKFKDFFLSSDGITATGWKMNDIQASLFSGNIAKSREDLLLLDMAEDYYRGNKTPENTKAIQELNRRKPGFLNSAAVYANKTLDWLGNNSITGTTGAFLGTDELDKVRIGIDFDENTTSEQALQNIQALRNSYMAFDKESYDAYLENHNKARYYENMLNSEYKRKLDVSEGRIADENGVVDGSIDFFNFSKLAYQLPGIIAGSISSPSQMVGSFATGAATAYGILATTAAATAAVVGTGGWGAVAIPAALTATGTASTFGLNQAQGAHENSAEVDEGYMSKVRYALEQHPKAAADFYKRGRSILGNDATDEEIIVAKLVNKIPATNKIIDKIFDEAATGSQRQYDRDMVATTGDSTIDTALQITPLKFFSTLGKSAIKANLRSSRIARAANKVAEKVSKLNAGDEGVLRKAFGRYGALVSGEGAAVGTAAGALLDNTLGRIPKVNTAIKSMAQFDIAKIKRLGPKTSNWINYGESILGRGVKSAISEGIEEGKQYYNQQRAVQEFQEGLKNSNLSYETQTILGDVLDDFLAGDFAASGLVQAITGIPLLDALHYTDTNIIDAAEAIKNIKSGMVGGHGQTTMMTAINGFRLTTGTHGAIDDMELAIRALENSKLTALKLFAQDLILSRTNSKYIASAIEYLKNSSSIKLTDQELEELLNRAVEVKGVSDSPYMKALAKEQKIAKEDYHKFVADYMYHKDNLETEGENLRSANVDLDTKANEIKAASEKIANPSDVIAEEWSKNDVESERRSFENNKTSQVKKLQDHLKTLKDKLEKEALTNSQKAEVENQIVSTEESLKNAEEAKFDESKKISYAQARFDRINTIARIRGMMKQLNFLNSIFSTMGDDNTTGKEFVQELINATKKLLNSYLTGNQLRGKLLTADNLDEVNEWASIIARNIERGDQDNMNLMGASAELSGQIESLSLAYQEQSKAVLNYNIAANLFNKFVGYNVNDENEVVPEGTEGARHIKGNGKKHLEGILAAQDDDAQLELAYKQGFADYGFSGVYKDESPVVEEERREEEERKPGTTERRNRIKELGNKIREFASKTKDYISGKWKNIGNRKIFVPDEPEERTTLDPSDKQLNAHDYYVNISVDYIESDDVEKWLNNQAIDTDDEGIIKSNAHLLTAAFLDTKQISDDVMFVYGAMDERQVDVYYDHVKIGTITPIVLSNKADGGEVNSVLFKAEGFDLDRIEDDSYLESIAKNIIELKEKDPEEAPEETPEEQPEVATPINLTEQQEAKILVLNDLTEKMNKKFDVSLRTSSHYFEWVGTGENRKLKLWHRLHDEIGGYFKEGKQSKLNWSQQIKKLYSVVYHKGYSEDDQEGTKDILALLDHLRNFYESDLMNERLLENIEGYVLYLEQEGNDISDTDLYECIKGISEEIAPEVKSNKANRILDRGTAIDVMCRTIFGTAFNSLEEALAFCKTLKITSKFGTEVSVKDFFTNEAFESAITHLWNTKKVYVEDLGYTLWTAPFTIYTEDFNGVNGSINIAGEVDMLAIDKDGNIIIIDYKTSKNPFFLNGEESPSFKTASDNQTKSAKEQYTNQQSAYVLMLNETTSKETTVPGGFNCNEARLLPILLVNDATGELVGKVKVEFSKDQLLTLLVTPFKQLGENIIFDKETYRYKLAQLSRLYAKVEYIANHLRVYAVNKRDNFLIKLITSILEDLDSMLLCLQEITGEDLQKYEEKINKSILFMQESYFGNKNTIDSICKKYSAGELLLLMKGARSYNNIDWDNPLNDNDIDKLGGFESMGVKDRKEYDEKVEELAHVSCNKDFANNATAKLTAVEYKTRRGNDKIAIYASITYNNVTYPPIRIYLSETDGLQFAKDVLDGNTFGAEVQTTVGLLSKCSDGEQHLIGENKQLVEAIGGTEENPYENFMVDVTNNATVAVVTFNKGSNTLSTVSGDPNQETEVKLPKTLRSNSANGHLIINIIPENSKTTLPIPIICNTPKIDERLGKDPGNHRTQSLLLFLTETVLPGLNDIESSFPLKEKVRIDGEEIPLTYGLLLNFFFEPYDEEKGELIQRPQYRIMPPGRGESSWYIQIGNLSREEGVNRAKIIPVDDTKALKDAISQLSVWISLDMASVKWNSSKKGSKQFNEFAKFLSNLEDGEKFYLGGTGIYFDKSDADGTFLGFLAKNGLLTTPFNGFSHPLISINGCQKEPKQTSPALGEEDGPKIPDEPITPQEPGILPDEELPDDELLNYSFRIPDEDEINPHGIVRKILKGLSKLDKTAARQYIELVLGKSFANLEFVDEISSAIVGGLSAGTIIAGQVTANMMKLSNYALNGTEYHEAFHWAFELIINPRESKKIRDIVRKKYGITDEREIAEWLADAYMYYVRDIYVPKGTLLLKAFAKIKQWAITFKSMFTGQYQMYKLFNDINSGKFANRPINNEAVLNFQEKFQELNQTVPTAGYEKDGVQYSYQQGPIDHELNIKQLAFVALFNATGSPAINYATNTPLTINVKDILKNKRANEVLMMHISKERLIQMRLKPNNRKYWKSIDNALALRELIDDEHIDKTQEYISAYIDNLIGVKGKDLSVNGEDSSSSETTMGQEYADVENGDDVSFAGSPKEHIVPDHLISRMSKTSSRIKLFFATIPILSSNRSFGTNEFGKLGYYDLHYIYQAVQNRYHHVLSPEALYNAIQEDSKSNMMIKSLWDQISVLRKLASRGNDNAKGLLNEIYRSIKSTKQSHEVTKTRRDPDTSWVTYRSVNIMVQNNSFAISREFTDTVLGGLNRFYEPITIKDKETGKDISCIKVRDKILDEHSDSVFDSSYRITAYDRFFGHSINGNFEDVYEIIDKNTGERKDVKILRPIFSLYDIIVSYGTPSQRPFYFYDESKRGYVEADLEKNISYVKFSLIEALSSIGVDITEDQLDDILETQFCGVGILQIKQLLTEKFTLPAKGNTHKAGTRLTLIEAADNVYNKINSILLDSSGIIGPRKTIKRNEIVTIDDRSDVFINPQLHILMATLIAKAQQEKYEVSGRSVDGKLTYAMSDDNTVTAMCDVVFDKTGDPQCTKIRQMIMNDPFNMSNGTDQFGRIPVGSYILPRIIVDRLEIVRLHDKLDTLNDELNKDDIADDRKSEILQEITSVKKLLKEVELSIDTDYEIVNDGGIETGNNENSSTNSEKRGADTIISIITKLCLNMIVLAPFADKSTALGIRLRGIQIPGIDYDRTTYTFREKKKDETLRDDFKFYILAIDVDSTGRVRLGSKSNKLDETVAQYVLAEYNLAKKAIQDYEDILRNHAVAGSKTEVEEKYRTAFNICKKLMFMSQFSGDYVQNENGEWEFNPFGIEKGSNKTELEAAKEMISQFEAIVNDRDSLLQFVNRHINGLMLHEIEKLKEYGIVSKKEPNDIIKNPRLRNQLLDRNILSCIFLALNQKNWQNHEEEERAVTNEKAILIFMYDIVGKSIISKQESERLFTGQSDLYEIKRDAETKIITVPYQDQAKRIGSFASTGTVGVIEDEDYVCAEIPDDMLPIKDLVVRSVYMNEIANYIKTGDLNMDEHPGFDFRFATTDQLKELIPNEFRPIIDQKVDNILKGFVLEKNGRENKNNVTDGVSFISANFAKKLLKAQGAWNYKIAKAFKILTSEDKQDIEKILNSWETFSEVFTQVIGTLKYTAVGFRTEMVNGLEKTIQYVNKTALFPVFACMCNEKMDAIRRQMETQKVDMLMFESAVKVGAHGNSDFTVDSSGNVTGLFNTYSQKSFFLRKQLNTDPNEKEKMKIGIQTVKVALSAAIGEKELEWEGELVDGDVIIELIMKDIKALTVARYNKLSGKLNTTNDVVNYVSNFLRGNNVPEHVIEAFQNGVPAEALSIQKHIDTLSAKRIQEDIVRIDSPGSAFIQRCVYGVEGPNVKFGNLELNDGEELKVVNSDGSMDCVLSIDYFVEYRNGVPYFKLTPGKNKKKLTVHDPSIGKERPMSFEEIRQWLKSNGVIGKNARASILSYRIPTQAVASINALKCVDVIPVVRDTVVLPKLFTTITGADFDIDKLFISTVWYRMEEQEDGSYKPRQIDDDTTEEGLSNTVVNDYINILCATAKKHPEIFYRSIDDDTLLADDVISWIKGLYPPTEKDRLENASGVLHSMPSMLAKVHDEFLAGRLGIGPFALALVNHVLTRIYKVGFNSKNVYLKHKSLNRDVDDDGKSIMSWLSAMINKHVDVAKNPDITYLNVNDSTFNVVALLLRLGYGRRTFMFTCQEIMRDYAFTINQETAVCKYTKNENGYTDTRKEAFNKIVKKYKLKNIKEKLLNCSLEDIYKAACMEIFDRNVDRNTSLCEYVLEHHGEVPAGITVRIGKEDFKLTPQLFQYLNLQLFNYLSDTMAKPLSDLQQATVIDNERCITSMIQSSFYKQFVDKIKQSNTFYNIDKLFANSYIDEKINKVLGGMDIIYDSSSCMDKDVVTAVAKSIDPNILSYGKNRMNTFLSIVRDGMVAYYGAKFFDDYCRRNGIDKQKLLKSGPNGIVRRLAKIKASAKSNRGKYRSLRNNLLIQGLSTEGIIGEQYTEPGEQFYFNHRFMDYQFLRFKYAGQSDDNILADVQQAWDLLLNYPDEEILNFARDLIVYSFYTSGEMSGNTKLFKYVPPSWRIDSGYGDFFKQIKLDKADLYKNIDDIVDKLCRNLWYKEKFVRTIGRSTLARFLGSDILKSHKRTIFSGESIGEGEMSILPDPIFSPVIAGIQYTEEGKAYPIFKGDKDLCPRYLKCVDDHHDNLTNLDDSASAWTLYRLVGFNTYMDDLGKGWLYPVYVQTSALGEKYYRNNIFEYNEQLEPNNNLDAYSVTEEFLSKLGARVQKDIDITSALNNIMTLLLVVNAGVDLAFTGQEAEVAEQTLDILVDRKTLQTTFRPLKTKDEFLELRKELLKKQLDKFCNR